MSECSCHKSIKCKAVKVSALIKSAIEKKQNGEIVGVYSSCINILTESEKLITLFVYMEDTSPIGIISNINEESSFIDIGISHGMKVLFDDGKIYIPQAGFTCDLSQALTAYPSTKLPFFLTERESIDDNLDVLLKTLISAPKPKGACSYIKEFRGLAFISSSRKEGGLGADFLVRIGNLAKSIVDKDAKSIERNLYLTVGRGIGLTPSADDVILGISAWIYFLPGAFDKYKVWFESLRVFLEKEGMKRTTLVSKAYLEYGAKGFFTYVVHSLIASIMGLNKNAVIAAANEMISYGASSGSDICVGILVGSVITSNKIFEMLQEGK